MSNFSLIINAGGQSRRMGQPKALLPVPPNGQPLLTTIVRQLQALAPQATIVIANDPQIRQQADLGESVQWLADRYGEVGPLGGIASGLATTVGWAIFVACDMPLVNSALFAQLLTLAAETNDGETDLWDAVVPVVNGYPEPMHALYHRRCLAAVVARIKRGDRRATAFLPDLRVRYVSEAELRCSDPDLRSFVNVNTPEEWTQLLSLLGQEAF